jgi:hypothetical protein
MKNVNPLRTARRRAQRVQRLGCEHPFCLWCGCSDPMLLRPVTRSFLEDHHIFGIANDPDSTLALCFTCHALATEGLLQAGVTMTREPDSHKFAINMFRANAFHLRMLSEASGRFATYLEEHQDGSSAKVTKRPLNFDIAACILRKAWPVWKAYRGKVPNAMLQHLEKDGDWPRGCAKAAMRRISRDAKLRYQLENGVTVDE